MTELVVALDGPEPWEMLIRLRMDADVPWFKIGPQAMMERRWYALVAQAYECRIFLDLNLADTADTVRESIKRFADAGIAAVSTFTEHAMLAACTAAEDIPLKVWHVACLTSDPKPTEASRATSFARRNGAHGVIVPPWLIDGMPYRHDRWDIVVPAIRMTRGRSDGHSVVVNPQLAIERGATHIVVGRDVWDSEKRRGIDPVAAAREFIETLKNGSGL
jgi:orotidine-5'-phosphate decarboxylase